MKKIYIVLLACGLFIGCNHLNEPMPIPNNGDAQMPPQMGKENNKDNHDMPEDRKAQMEQIKMQKIAYMTQELRLTVEESEKFWPVYNEYWECYMKLQHDQFSANKKIEKKESPTLTDVEEIAGYFEQHAALIHKWSAEFAKVIPESKVVKVFIAEEKFKNYLLRKGPRGKNDVAPQNKGQEPKGPQMPQGPKGPEGEH